MLKDFLKETPKTKPQKTKKAVEEEKIPSPPSPEVLEEEKEPHKKPIHSEENKNFFIDSLGRTLKKNELWFGNPGTGKSYLAHNTCKNLKEKGVIKDYAVVNCHEELTVMSLFKTTKTDEQGNWKFLKNKVFKMLTDNKREHYIIVADEFNTTPMSVMKSLQPIIDDSNADFVFEDKVYKKNPNIRFIMTMNHQDLGTSDLPQAIKDRLYPVFFEDLTYEMLSMRTGVPRKIIEKLEKIRNMFQHLGDLPEFHKSVRQLKELRGACGKQLRDYIVSQLALAHIEYNQAIDLSPEFKDIMESFDATEWGE